ncbi:MAG: hypothetical protein PUP91_38015, partial [Rhizonema sp. PD37]|nr:hypothetical protein [Rhizonema sp. PD37]
MPPVPFYLIFLTVIIVVLPSIASIFYRWTLYKYLVSLEENIRRLINGQSPRQQPKIIEELQQRFRLASSQLDQINTSALIDQVYSREKVGVFTCEQIEYFCRILPNLLLAFGLFGTLLGITINLSAINQTINQTNITNINDLVTELKKPLEGMSIAFFTSLTGIFFSALLTLFNWFRNTNLAKYRVISSLEDYLDNIYHPEVQGDTRLDKIVNRMVSQQDEFLTRFGSTVRDAVEQSIGSVARQIAEGNKEATALAKQVYERFTESAGTISAAANEFEHTITEMNAKSHIFKESAEIFAQSQFPQQLSASIADLSNIQENFSQSAASLAKTTQFIETAIQELTTLAIDTKNINQTLLQVLDLHQSHQNSLSQIIPQLNQGANSFSKAINQLDKLEQEITNKSDSLNKVETTLRLLIEVEKTYTSQVNLSIEALGDRLIKNLSQQVDMSKSNFIDIIQSNSEKIS